MVRFTATKAHIEKIKATMDKAIDDFTVGLPSMIHQILSGVVIKAIGMRKGWHTGEWEVESQGLLASWLSEKAKDMAKREVTALDIDPITDQQKDAWRRDFRDKLSRELRDQMDKTVKTRAETLLQTMVTVDAEVEAIDLNLDEQKACDPDCGRLIVQKAALVELLKKNGIDVPPHLADIDGDKRRHALKALLGF